MRDWRSGVARWIRSTIRCTQLRAGARRWGVGRSRNTRHTTEAEPMTLPNTSSPPKWTDQLREAVLWSDRTWAAPESVSMLAATREVQRWLTDPRPYNRQHRPGWRSAIADFERGAGDLGPDVRR